MFAEVQNKKNSQVLKISKQQNVQVCKTKLQQNIGPSGPCHCTYPCVTAIRV